MLFGPDDLCESREDSIKDISFLSVGVNKLIYIESFTYSVTISIYAFKVVFREIWLRWLCKTEIMI